MCSEVESWQDYCTPGVSVKGVEKLPICCQEVVSYMRTSESGDVQHHSGTGLSDDVTDYQLQLLQSRSSAKRLLQVSLSCAQLSDVLSLAFALFLCIWSYK